MEGNDGQHRHEPIRRGRHPQRVVGNLRQFAVSLGADADDRALAGADFLNVARVFLEEGIVGRDENGRHVGIDQRDDAMLQLRTRVARG